MLILSIYRCVDCLYLRVFIMSVQAIQLFEGYCRRRSNKMSKRANKSITEFFVNKLPWHELT